MKLISVRLFNTEVASLDDRGQWRFAESTSPCVNWYAGIHRTVFPMTVEDMIQASSAKRLTPEDLVYMDGTLSIRPKCECGASKCGSSIHSTWCPASKP